MAQPVDPADEGAQTTGKPEEIEVLEGAEDPAKAAKEIPAAAKRALAEAAARRAEEEKHKQELERELGGRDGPEPTRFGDWEKKGIAHDF